MPELRKGDAVMFWGLVNRADLNKFCGVVTHPLAPGGAFATRVGVKVFNNNATESVRVKPENLLPIGKDGKVTLPNGTEVLPTKIVPATEGEHVAEASTKPNPKYNDNRNPPPVRSITRDEALGPNPCAGLCPRYPNCTAARLVAYLLNKVDYVTPSVKADYDIATASGWYLVRERLIKLLDADEENAAEVLHEEHLVNYHTKTRTPASLLPADWDALKERVATRQQKDKGPKMPAPAPAPAPAPDHRARALKAMQAVARNHSIKEDRVFACPRCGAHRPLGYRCCGTYMGMNGAEPVPRRNIHEHPDADEDEVADFLEAALARTAP
jgi:hypothetical protein